MGTPRLYSCDDAGAPVLSDVGRFVVNTFILMLDACLVTGYGSKPGAGWTKILTEQYAAAYRSASGNTIVLIRYLNTWGFSITLMDYAAFEGGTGANWLKGEHIRSGSNALAQSSPISSAFHRFGIHGSYDSNYRQYFRWCVAADDETFIVATSNGAGNSATDWSSHLYVGEYINYSGLTGKASVIAMGGVNSAGDPNNTTSYNSPFTSGVTLLRNPTTGLMNFPWVYPLPDSTLDSQSSNREFRGSDVLPASLHLSPIDLRLAMYQDGAYYANGGIIGRLKGAAYDGTLMHQSWRATHKVLGLPLNYTGMGAIATDANGRSYAPASLAGVPETSTATYGYFNLLLTDHPDFW